VRTEYLGAPAVTQAAARGGYDDPSYWDGAGASGSPRIKIDLNQQRAYFYKGATLAGVAVVSSGREAYGTPPGKFKVVQKNADHASNLYGDYVDAAGNVVKKDVDVTVFARAFDDRSRIRARGARWAERDVLRQIFRGRNLFLFSGVSLFNEGNAPV